VHDRYNSCLEFLFSVFQTSNIHAFRRYTTMRRDDGVGIRRAAVAGAFYPAGSIELREQVQAYLRTVPAGQDTPLKAVVVPHAGYMYSGPVAASVYGRLQAARNRVHRIVLVGPSHRVPFRGLATCSDSWFETPLGRVPVDREALESLSGMQGVVVLDPAHELEHSLEVQIPFLQEVFSEFQLVPLVAGEAAPETVGAVLERLWGGPETLIVISSDLSHYLPYEAAREKDERTSRAIEALQYGNIDGRSACGCIALSGLLWAAARKGLRCETVDLRNSGDTAGDRSRVVGYGGYVFQ